MKPTVPAAPRPRLNAFFACVLFCACSGVGAADLVVRVSGLSEPLGQVGCSLFAGANGFPMDNSTARVRWLPADVKGVTCRFVDMAIDIKVAK